MGERETTRAEPSHVTSGPARYNDGRKLVRLCGSEVVQTKLISPSDV
jgi:hypothetical protein